MTAITHITLADSDGAPFVPVARARAANLYERLVRAKQLVGSHRFEVNLFDKTFYVEVRIQRPHVWIYIDSKKCPSYLSGLVWIKSWFEPTIEEDGVEYLRTLFAKATPTEETDVSKLAGIAEQMKTLRPTMFSGEMRKVVQVLMGQGKSVPYLPGASVTHGVFRSANGRPWIIKISSSGVVAYPMLVCMGKNTPVDLGYTPLPTEEPEDPLVLLDEDGIRDAYRNKSVFYGSCGWAFSESGAEASNCFIGSENIYSYSWQYTISIQADPDTGAPVSASLSLVAEGYIHGPKSTHMKYPRADVFGALRSFDPYRGNANYRKDCAAPVHCYYDGEALQTYYYVYYPSSSYSREDAHVGSATICLEWFGTEFRTGTYTVSARPVIRLNSTQGAQQVNDSRSRLLRNWERELGIGSINPGTYPLDNDATLTGLYWMVRVDRETGNSDISGGVTNVLIVPAQDREFAYIAESESGASGGTRVTVTYHTMQRYYCLVKSVEACEATSDTGSIAFAVQGIAGQNYADDSCQSGYRFGVLFGAYVWEGTGPGSVITWRKQLGYVPGWNGCLSTVFDDTRFYAPNNGSIPSVDYDTPRKTWTNRKLSAYASGGVRLNVDASEEALAQWMKFIEIGMNDQSVNVVRDAFNSDRYACTTTPNENHGYVLQESPYMNPYDLDLVSGSTLLFVGVP